MSVLRLVLSAAFGAVAFGVSSYFAQLDEAEATAAQLEADLGRLRERSDAYAFGYRQGCADCGELRADQNRAALGEVEEPDAPEDVRRT